MVLFHRSCLACQQYAARYAYEAKMAIGQPDRQSQTYDSLKEKCSNVSVKCRRLSLLCLNAVPGVKHEVDYASYLPMT